MRLKICCYSANANDQQQQTCCSFWYLKKKKEKVWCRLTIMLVKRHQCVRAKVERHFTCKCNENVHNQCLNFYFIVRVMTIYGRESNAWRLTSISTRKSMRAAVPVSWFTPPPFHKSAYIYVFCSKFRSSECFVQKIMVFYPIDVVAWVPTIVFRFSPHIIRYELEFDWK